MPAACCLRADELTKGIPQNFDMRTTTQSTAPMLAFSMDQGGSIGGRGWQQDGWGGLILGPPYP